MRRLKFKLKLLHRRHRGLTLVEILLTLGILGVIWVFVSSIFLSGFRIFSEQKTATYVASQNRLALDEISNQVRQAQAVSGNCTVCSGDTTSSASILILQLWPLVNGQPTDPGSGNPDYIVYKRDSASNLIRKIFPASNSDRKSSTKIIATNVSSLTFTYNNPNFSKVSQVNVSTSNQALSLVKTITKTQTAQTGLRNTTQAEIVATPFLYAIQTSQGDLEIAAGDTTITGNIHSNKNLVAGCNGPDVCNVIGNASVVGTYSCPASCFFNVSGQFSVPPPAVPSQPLPNVQPDYWKNLAEAGGVINCGGVCSTNDKINNYKTLGNVKLRGDLSVVGNLTITGPVWITGDLLIGDLGKIYLDSTSCTTTGTVVVVDGKVDVGDGTKIFSTTTTPKNYILLAVLNKDGSSSPLSVKGQWQAILYSPSQDHTSVEIKDDDVITGAIAGGGVKLASGNTVTHDPDLATAKFSSCL